VTPETDSSKKRLKNLLVDPNEASEERLVEILKPYANLNEKTGDPIFHSSWDTLSIKGKVLVYLVARKAAVNLERLETEVAPPAIIERQTAIKGGSLRPALRGLLDDGFVQQDADGAYLIPNPRLAAVRRFVLDD